MLLATWPGRLQRDPSRSLPSWPIRRPLADWLRREGQAAAGKDVLDVGCGVRPYYPFFHSAGSYVGVDVGEDEGADLIGSAEALPVSDASFDIILCTQVLEHVDDPAAVVRELHRVTTSGGRVLASTHGVMLYHPNPQDLWRWTQAGLLRLFENSAQWSQLSVEPGAGSAACLGMLIGSYVHLLAKRARVPHAAAPATSLINSVSSVLDRRVALLRDPVPGALFANFHVTAIKA